MSVFDLPGPQFLAVYAALALAITIGLWLLRRQQEAPPTSVQRIDDPYQFAFLRRGHREAVHLAVFSLIHRKLIVAPGGKEIRLAAGVSTRHAEHPFEQATLGALRSPGTLRALTSALRRNPVLATYDEYLRANGLLPDADARLRRAMWWLAGAGALLVVAGIKVAIGLSRERPVSFLLILCAISAVVTFAVCFPRRTVSGDRLVEHMLDLFSAGKRRVISLDAHRDANELTWLAAVFGLQALPTGLIPEALKRPASDSSGSSSGCGSSCGSSCGGGGGGCGGCGS